MGLYSGGLIIGRISASEIWGAYLREGLFLGAYSIGILRCFLYHNHVFLNGHLKLLQITSHVSISPLYQANDCL